MYIYQPRLSAGRQRIVLGSANVSSCAAIREYLQRGGWQVYTADNGPQIRQLSILLKPDAVVLDTDIPDESGWLTCAKLTWELPNLPVVLLTGKVTAENKNFARFVGATAIAPRSDDVSDVIEERQRTLLCSY